MSRRGRPIKPDNKRRTEVIAILVTPKEKLRIVKLARKEKQRVSSFARALLISALA